MICHAEKELCQPGLHELSIITSVDILPLGILRLA